jgi:hypothetical protein
VTIEDQYGNVETMDTSDVMLSVASGPGTLGGTTTVAAVNGVATFSNLLITQAGSYTLSAADSTDSLSGFTSNSFNILDETPPTLTGVTLNGCSNRGVSQTVSSTSGITSIQLTFSEAVNLTASDVLLQEVMFPGGVETLGATVTPSSVTGSGTSVITVDLTSGSAVGTWLKVVPYGTGANEVTDLVGNVLDGEPAVTGSGRGYIYSATDMPTGDGTAGGDAVFYVGSCIGDSSGDGKVNIFDAFAMNQAWGSQTGDAKYNVNVDFNGDGHINIFDAFQLNSHWGQQMDALPISLSHMSLGEMALAPAAEVPAENASVVENSVITIEATPAAEAPANGVMISDTTEPKPEPALLGESLTLAVDTDAGVFSRPESAVIETVPMTPKVEVFLSAAEQAISSPLVEVSAWDHVSGEFIAADAVVLTSFEDADVPRYDAVVASDPSPDYVAANVVWEAGQGHARKALPPSWRNRSDTGWITEDQLLPEMMVSLGD